MTSFNLTQSSYRRSVLGGKDNALYIGHKGTRTDKLGTKPSPPDSAVRIKHKSTRADKRGTKPSPSDLAAVVSTGIMAREQISTGQSLV